MKEIVISKIETIYRPIEDLQETPLSKVKKWPISSGEMTIGNIYYKKDKQSIISKIVEFGFNKRLEEKAKKSIQYWKEQGITEKSELLKKTKLSEEDFDKYCSDIDKEGNMSSDFYDRSQHRWKIRINSLYGALGNRYFHLFNIDNARCITLTGQHLIKFMSRMFNDYFKNEFYKNKDYFDDINENNKIKKDVVRLIDTDSNYISLEEVVKVLNLNFKNSAEYRDWALDFNKKVIIPLIDKSTDLYDSYYNSGRSINFKPEKIIESMFVTGRKHYASYIVDDEGIDYSDNLKFKNIGIEVKKRDKPFFIRTVLEKALRMILDKKSKKELNEFMREKRKEFEKQAIEEIAVRGSISSYDKYSVPLKLKNGTIQYAFKSPARNKAAVNYNFLIKELKLIKEPAITNGDLMCFIAVKPNNKYKFTSVGFLDKWPEEFNKIFEIDYDALWNKTCIQLADRWWNILGYDNVKTEINSFDDIFG